MSETRIRHPLTLVRVAFLAASTACGSDLQIAAPSGDLTLRITPAAASIRVGRTADFTVSSGNAERPTLLRCISSAPLIASVTIQGSSCRVTATAVGTATITATVVSGQSVSAVATIQPDTVVAQ